MSGVIQVLNTEKLVKIFNIHGCTKNLVVDYIYIYIYIYIYVCVCVCNRLI